MNQPKNLISQLGALPDIFVGHFARYIHRISPPHPNTWNDLPQYYNLELEQFFPTPQAPPRISSRFPKFSLHYLIDTFSFPSQHHCICPRYQQRHEMAYPRNGMVLVRHVRPLFRKRRRALIYIHGWMEPGGIIEASTIMPMLSLGLDVDLLNFDLPFHGSRKSLGDLFHGEYFWSADLVRSIEALRQSVIDIRTIVRWLRNVGYQEVGIAGVSLGGVLALITACAEPDIDYAVPIIAHFDLVHAVENSPILAHMKEDLDIFGITSEQLEDAMEKVGLHKLKPKIPKENVLFVAADNDQFLSSERIEALWESWNRPPIYWFSGGHLMIVVQGFNIFWRIKKHLRTIRKRKTP